MLPIMQKLLRPFVCGLLAGPLLASAAFAADSATRSASERVEAQPPARLATITVTVDPRVELVAITQHLSGYAERERYRGRINAFDHPYINRMKEHFAAFKGDESIRKLAQLGVGGSDPVGIAVSLSNPDDVAFQGPIDRTLVRTSNAEAYATSLRAFAVTTGFMAYFEETKADREAIVRDFMSVIEPRDLAARVEDYCGAQPARYVIVLAPLLGRTSFGPNVTQADNTRIFYAVLPPGGAENGRLTWGSPGALGDYICHEFTHSFVNPLVDRHWAELSKHSGLMDTVQRRSGNYGDDWKIYCYENIVRAVVARMVLREKGEVAYTRQVGTDQARGFPFVAALCRSLERYEQSRDTYPDLESYFPELIRAFDEAAHPTAGDSPRQQVR